MSCSSRIPKRRCVVQDSPISHHRHCPSDSPSHFRPLTLLEYVGTWEGWDSGGQRFFSLCVFGIFPRRAFRCRGLTRGSRSLIPLAAPPLPTDWSTGGGAGCGGRRVCGRRACHSGPGPGDRRVARPAPGIRGPPHPPGGGLPLLPNDRPPLSKHKPGNGATVRGKPHRRLSGNCWIQRRSFLCAFEHVSRRVCLARCHGLSMLSALYSPPSVCPQELLGACVSTGLPSAALAALFPGTPLGSVSVAFP